MGYPPAGPANTECPGARRVPVSVKVTGIPFHKNRYIYKMLNCLKIFFSFTLALMVTSQSISAQGFGFPGQLAGFVRFTNFTPQNGLPDEKVIDILQDTFGLMWFATPDGLVSYDGYKFTTFIHAPDDTNTLSSNLITSLAGGSRGDLWIGTSKGLHYYHRQTGRFEKVFDANIRAESLKATDYICKVVLTGHKFLWVETADGKLCKYNLKDRQWYYYRHTKPDQLYYYYHAIFEEDENTLWIGGRSTGPFRFDVRSGTFTTFQTHPDDPALKRPDAACFFKDSRGAFYVSGIDGLFIFSSDSARFRKIFPYSTFSITEDKEGYLWLGTGSGLVRYSPVNNEFTVFSHTPDNPFSLVNNHIYKVYLDRRGCLWSGTREGLSVLSPKQNRFFNICHISNNKNTPSSDKITALHTDREGQVWVGHYANGFDIVNPKTFIFSNYVHNPANANSLAGDRVSAFYEDSRGIMWIGLWTGRGFNRYDPRQKIFRKYSLAPSSLKFDWYSAFMEDNLGRFYLGFWGSKGVTLFDRETEAFGRNLYFDRKDRVTSRLTNTLYRDRNGLIWIGTTDDGFSIYNPFSDKVKSYPAGDDGTGNVSPVGLVHCFLQDKAGRMWIGGDELFVFMPSTGEFTSVSKKYKFPTGEVRGIAQDASGRIWATTAKKGLFCIEPQTMSSMQFTSDEGLGTHGFNKAITMLPNGWILLGSNNGLCLFDPQSITNKTIFPMTFFSGIGFMGENQAFDPQVLQKVVIPVDVEYFSVSFASDDYHNPAAVSYTYLLEGHDETWRIAPKKNPVAVFNRPPPGVYTLRLKAGYDGLTWSETESTLIVVVEPRYHQTWWFRIALLVTILGFTAWVLYNRVKGSRLRHQTVELEQRLLRLQMNPHFIFNSLFAIQNYIYENNPDEAGRYLSSFALLVRNILENSRVEFIPLEKEIKTLQLYLDLQSLRFSHKFSYSVYLDDDLEHCGLKVPPMLAQPFIENAIEHGIRNVEDGNIQIRFEKNNQVMVIGITDNGPGILQQSSAGQEAGSHQSLATLITAERIKLINKKYNTRVSIEITDLAGLNPPARGTRVRFSIPLNLTYA